MKTPKQSSNGIKIESGIPMPERSGKTMGAYRSVLRQMKDGDSFLVESLPAARIAHMSANQIGIKSSVRRQDDGKYRVWKIGSVSE